MNSAKPDSKELPEVYKSHLKDCTLLLCDSLKSYGILSDLAEYTIKDINTSSPADASFFHLNSISNQLAFNTRSYFTQVFRQYTGITPSEYREKYGIV